MPGYAWIPVPVIQGQRGLGRIVRTTLGIGYRYPSLARNGSPQGGIAGQGISHLLCFLLISRARRNFEAFADPPCTLR